jgi:hypothetical protein
VFDENGLHSFFVRRVLENLCSQLLQQDGYKLLNDTPEKRGIRKIAQSLGLPEEQVPELVRLLKSSKGASLH